MTDQRPLLATLPNPAWRETFAPAYQVRVETDELTFLGKEDQPDFATLVVEYEPYRAILELKSFKKYVQAFAGKLFSYERLANEVFYDLATVLTPDSLHVSIACHARGGARTKVSRSSRYPAGRMTRG